MDMPRPRPPHLHRETTRHGRTVWFVRIDHGPRVRLRADYGSPEFSAEYQAAIASNTRKAVRGPTDGTLAWAIGQYRGSSAWSTLSPATRQRENIFRKIIDTAGNEPLGACPSIRRILLAKDERVGF
jgi:hypothetical protein